LPLGRAKPEYATIRADLDEAIGIASRIPGARKGTVEVRPVLELAGLPTGMSV
jgi:hypothetical protein